MYELAITYESFFVEVVTYVCSTVNVDLYVGL